MIAKNTTQPDRLCRHSLFLTVITFFAAAVFLAPPAHAAWTEPSASPPGGNVAAPLNISSTAQTKAGELNVQGIFRAQGGLEASGGSGSFPISATAPIAPAGTVSGGVVGYGASAVGTGISVGVYGISVETPGGGTHVGLLGVAGRDSGNSIGVYGWDGDNTSAYAGYFLGRVGVDGELCLNNDCRQTWPEGGPGGGSSLFTENPQNNTYLTNTGSNLAIGGTQGNDAAFFFTVSPQANRGVFYTEKSIVIGPPPIVTENDGICSVGEACGQGNVDCWGQQDGCVSGQICDPAGSGQCVASDTIPPTPPGQLNVDGQPTAGVIPLTWQASSDQGGSGLAGYRIYRCEGASCMPTALLVDTHDTATAYADTTVVPNQAYGYLAKAYDGADNLSNASNILVVTTPAQGDTTPPTSPQNLRLNGTVLANLIPLAWDPSTDDGGSGLYGYKVYRCEGVGCTPVLYDVIGLETTYDDSGVSPAIVYVYRVSAFDADGNESALSPSLQVTTPSDGIAPSIPQNFRFPGPSGLTSISLAWDPSTDDGGSGLNGYKIYRCEGAGCVPTVAVHTVGLSSNYLDIGLNEATTYNYEITAIDGALNESAHSNRIEGTTGGHGGSPAILKGDDGTPPGGGGGTGSATPPNDGISRSSFTTPVTEPLVTGAAPLSTLLRVPTAQAKIDFFAIPEAQAAVPFGGNPNTRLMVNDGVVQIKDAGGNTMELGNSGSDIASSTVIALRPNTIPGSQGAEFFSVSGHTQLRLTGAIEIGAGTSQNAGMIQFNASTNDFEGFDGTQWKSFTTGGGGAVSNSDQVIWNTLAGTPLGGFPQTGGFHLTQQGIVNSFVAGPTYANPPTDYTVTGASLYVNGSNSTVGINTVAPNASYKLDVSGDANATRLCIAGDCRALWPSGGGGGIDGNGIANAIPMWFDVDTLTSSAIFQEGTNISIGDQTAAYPLDVVGQANAAELGLSGDFISGWDELILNQLTPAQPANFNITGSGTIETKLTVGETLELPTYNRTSFKNRIDRYNAAYEGHYISSKYVFGAEPGDHWGVGFFTDELTASPIVVVNQDREVHLGYVGAATDLCLYGSGVRECRDSWPSGGGAVSNSDQVIWNTLATEPLGGFPQTGGFHLTQQGIVNSLIAGPTYANPPTDYTVTGATLFVTGSSGNVGIGDTSPAELLSVGNGDLFRVNSSGNLTRINNVAYSWPAGYNGGGKYLRTDNAGNLSWEDAVGSDGITGSGTAGRIPKFLTGTSLGDSVISESGGNIGIGSATPLFDLAFGDQDTGIDWVNDGDLSLKSNGTDFIYLTELNGGSVGVRTANPNTTFQLGPVGTGTGQTGVLSFRELAAQGANYVGFKAPDAIGSNVTWTLPAADGANGHFLSTNGSGTLSWAAAGGSVITDADQVVWNTGATPGTYLGDMCPAGQNTVPCPQPAGGFNLAQQGIVNSLIAGPIYVDAPDDYSILRATLYVSGSNGKVGIHTMNPQGELHIRTNNDAIVLGGDTTDNIAWLGVASNFNPDQALTLEGMQGIRFLYGGTETEAMRVASNGEISVGGDADPDALFSVGGISQFQVNSTGGIQSGVNGQDGRLTIFSEQGGTDYSVIFQPGTQTQNITYTLPTNDGDAGQFLSTNGSGALSWAAAGESVITDTDQVVWNTGAALGTYLGSMCPAGQNTVPCPQPAGGFNLAQQGIVNSLIAGPTYVNAQPGDPPAGDYTIMRATLSVTGPEGRVGINTISPGQEFEVFGDALGASFDRTSGFTGIAVGHDGGGIMFRDYGQAHASIQYDGTADRLSFTGNTSLYGDGDYGTVTSYFNGNVGIGTANPQHSLEVMNNDADITVYDSRAASGSASLSLNTGGQVIRFKQIQGDRLAIDNGASTEWISVKRSNGNVGIGKTDPGARLDVFETNSPVVRSIGAQNPSFKVERSAGGTLDLAITNGAGLWFNNVVAGDAIIRYGASNNLRIGNNPNADPLVTVTTSAVGISQMAPRAKLTISNNLSEVSNPNDGIGIYADTADGSALYAKQQSADAESYAGYFSGKVNIDGQLKVNLKPIGIQCPPKWSTVAVAGGTGRLMYDECNWAGPLKISIVNPRICTGNGQGTCNGIVWDINNPSAGGDFAICRSYGLDMPGYMLDANGAAPVWPLYWFTASDEWQTRSSCASGNCQQIASIRCEMIDPIGL